jgi:Domain of unknown function (DUF1707)
MTGEVSPTSQPGNAALRASHADRDATVELLRVAAGDGRLTPEELDDRLAAALTARTLSELAVLTSDLPAAPGQPASLPHPRPKDLVRFNTKGGNVTRTGHWVVPAAIEATVVGGNVVLNLTGAVISQPELAIEANIRGGHLVLVTRPGIAVDVDDLEMRGGNMHFGSGTDRPAPLILRVAVSGRITGGNLVVRLPRRTFWQWLTRQPRPYAAGPDAAARPASG